MSVLDDFTECIMAAAAAPASASLEKSAIHLFDTLAALQTGRPLAESVAVAQALTGPDALAPGATWSAIVENVSAARATEIDDIHLGACVTPSAVVVPVTLLVARAGGVTDGRRILAAAVAGYEAMVRFGCAIDGPALLARGIWPTPVCAAVGAAASTATLLKVSPAELANALSLAASLATGINVRGDAPTGRWTPVALGAANGAFVALAARRGLQADPGLFDGRWSAATGIALDGKRLIAESAGTMVDTLSLKPWCGARQTMAAGSAFRDLLASSGVAANRIAKIVVEVPSAYRGMIDRHELARERQDTFADLRYTLGLIAYAPAALYDVARTAVVNDPRIEALARKTEIKADKALAAHYPARWPARVTFVDATGHSHEHETTDVPGDPSRPLDRKAVVAKFARVTGGEEETAAVALGHCLALVDGGSLTPVLDAAGLS